MSDWDKDTDIQRLRFLQSLKPDELLCELLAGIHGDGGHHTDKVGLYQSVFDAEVKLGKRIEEIDTLRNSLIQTKLDA